MSTSWKRTKKFIRFIIKGIGAFAFFILVSIPELECLQGKGLFESLLLCIAWAVPCCFFMVLSAMVCNAEIQEEKEMKVRIRKEK
jgi:hypothetical protein